MLYHPGFEALREVARQGSFIKAARILGISGPAISKQIKNLEARLNLVLLHRTTRCHPDRGAGVSPKFWTVAAARWTLCWNSCQSGRTDPLGG